MGTSDFTCCQRNHTFGDRVVPCDRGITRKILEGMIEAKVQHFFKLDHILRARLCICLANWWLRTKSIPNENHSNSLDSFKTFLRWNESEEHGVPILLFAVIRNEVGVVEELLSKNYENLNAWVFDKSCFVEFGFPTKSFILHYAMSLSGVRIVQMLLERGVS